MNFRLSLLILINHSLNSFFISFAGKPLRIYSHAHPPPSLHLHLPRLPLVQNRCPSQRRPFARRVLQRLPALLPCSAGQENGQSCASHLGRLGGCVQAPVVRVTDFPSLPLCDGFSSVVSNASATPSKPSKASAKSGVTRP